MPRYYCDYCDTYLTHDSPSVRKQHNAGYKHKANVRSYYQKFEEQQTQALLDQRIKERLGQAAAYQQIGAAYNQHLAAFPGQPPRLPIMPPPVLPIPGAPAPQLVPGVRPPMLPRPVPGAPVYSVPPMVAPVPGQPPGAPPSLPMQPIGMPNPNSAAPVPGGVAPPGSSSMYQSNPAVSAAPAANTPAGSYTFAPPSAPSPAFAPPSAPASAPETNH